MLKYSNGYQKHGFCNVFLPIPCVVSNYANYVLPSSFHGILSSALWGKIASKVPHESTLSNVGNRPPKVKSIFLHFYVPSPSLFILIPQGY